MIYAGTRGYLDKIDVKRVQRWKSEFSRYMDTTNPQVGRMILETGGTTTSRKPSSRASSTSTTPGRINDGDE